MRKANQERPALAQTDCVEIALALRVLADHIRTEAQSGADKKLPTPVEEQATRLEILAGRFEKAEGLDFSIEGMIHTLANEPGKAADAEGISPEDMDLAAEGLRILADILQANGDSHAEKIRALGQTVSDARGCQTALLGEIGQLRHRHE